MAENYTVNYNINVNSAKAQEALVAFQTAAAGMATAAEQLNAFKASITSVIGAFSKLTKKTPVIKVKISQETNRKLDALIGRLEKINALANANRAITISTSNKKGANKGVGVAGGGSGKSGGGKSTTQSQSAVVASPKTPNGLGYKLLGPTPLPSNGGMAVDMLKGMGIAYGISGLGQAISSIVEQSVAYDNLMATVRNILKTHDEKQNFSSRFQSMSQTIRDVGMETKFTVSEVADAARFLAMAGFDLETIQQSIRPIADIALIGDTDLGKTADVTTNIMTAYNISADQLRKTADIMTNTFTLSNTTLMEIAESYKYAASLLSAGGVKFEEATAAIGVLGDAGIKGSQAGTTLRTIMANLANPTAKQKKAWDALGISSKDENGKVRPLIDIFKDLSEKNLAVGDYYKLFHKTAASGAVALTDHVAKWEKIYLENFLAGGLSATLADEKKNTLQGLWAQVTSTFTDTGVTAFQGIEGQLRSLMQSAIGYFRSDEAAESFKDIANAMTDFLYTIIQATKWFKNLFSIFGPFIQQWVKLSLLVWPIVKTFQILHTLLLGMSGLRTLGSKIAPFFTRAGWSGLAGVWNAVPESSKGKTNVGQQVPLSGWARTRRGIGNIWKGYGASAAGMGLGALAAYGAASFATREDANSYDYVTAGSLGMTGMLAMAGSKGGWIGAGVAGVIALTTWIISLKQHWDDLTDSVARFINETHKMNDGVLVNSTNKIERVLEYVWRKNYDINELMERRMELAKQLYGMNGVPDATTTNDVGNGVFGEWMRDFDTNHHSFWLLSWLNEGTANRAVDLFNAYAQRYGISLEPSYNNGARWQLKTPKGYYQYSAGGSIWNTDSQNAMMVDIAAAMEMLHGPYKGKIIEEYQKSLSQMFYGHDGVASIEGLKKDFLEKYNPANIKGLIMPNNLKVDWDDAKKWTGQDISKSWLGATLMYQYLQHMVENMDVISDFKQKLVDNTLTESDVVKALGHGDFSILGTALKDYDPSNVSGWFNNLGYNWTTSAWSAHGLYSEAQMATQTLGIMRSLLDAIKQLGLTANPATQNLQAFASIMMTMAQAFLGTGEPIRGASGEIKEVNGQTWKWDAPSEKWWTDIPVVGSKWLTPEQMGNVVGAKKSNVATAGLGDNFGGSNGSGGSRGGASAADYANHYSKTSATPKQVVVHIGSLMNVESIDLSNPDNAAVIANVKSELAQALVDVVHDFDETWHG